MPVLVIPLFTTIIAGVLMTPAPEPPISFDSTASRRSRR
jgi:hypothetical protein